MLILFFFTISYCMANNQQIAICRDRIRKEKNKRKNKRQDKNNNDDNKKIQLQRK